MSHDALPVLDLADLHAGPEAVERFREQLRVATHEVGFFHLRHGIDRAVVDELLREQKGLQKNDLVIIAAGSPPGVHGSTNTLRVHRIGDLDGTESARIEADRIATGQ
mgnify:CR=1 FL=1